MRYARPLTVALVVVSLVAGPALAQQFYVYPSQGQSPQQEAFDKAQCYNWAIQQTGFNPANPPVVIAPPPPPPPPGGLFGGALGGAAGGAALGAVGGAIGGDAGKGAAIGAGVGALFGLMRRNAEMQAQQQQQQNYQAQAQAVVAQGRANWERAYKACLAGRGYTVA